MGYKLLGFAVWRASKWYLGRRLAGAKRNLAVAGVGALLVGGAVLAGRSRASDG